MTDRDVIFRIAQVAQAIGAQANVGASETAGLIVSVLYEHPDWIEAFMRDGTGAFIDMGYSADKGALTFHRKDGKVTTPRELRLAMANHALGRRMEARDAPEAP